MARRGAGGADRVGLIMRTPGGSHVDALDIDVPPLYIVGKMWIRRTSLPYRHLIRQSSEHVGAPYEADRRQRGAPSRILSVNCVAVTEKSGIMAQRPPW